MKLNINIAIPAVAALAIMASCDDNSWNDKLDGFEQPGPYTKTETVSYTLTAADYSAIASNATNKALAEADGEADALAAVAANGCFATSEQARKYIPAFLASTSFQQFTLNNGSNVKVTYATTANEPEIVRSINAGVTDIRLTDEDYQEAWGSDDDYITAFAPMLPPVQNIPAVLEAAGNNGVAGDYLVVNYNYSSVNPVFGSIAGGDASDEPANGIYLEGDFTDGQGDFTIDNVNLPGAMTYIWSLAPNYSCMKASSYVDGVNYASESWLISPAIKLGATTNAVLTFEQACNFFSSPEVYPQQAVVAIREVGGKWTSLKPAYPESNSWSFVPSGNVDLSAWNGKTVEIGFGYFGNETKCGTWEVRNVRVLTGKAAARGVRRHAPVGTYTFTQEYLLLHNNGSALEVPADSYILQPADYTALGQTHANLSSTAPDLLLPAFLANKFPYAAEGDQKIVVYRYYASSATSTVARLYVKTAAGWVRNLGDTTDQFTRNDGKWAYNPSVVLDLPYSRNTDPSYTVFMACKDWVFTNVTKKLYPDAQPANGTAPGPPFIDYRNNAEFYSGASAYYGNVDVRATTAINNAPEGYTAYEGLSNEQVTELIKRRFCTETMPGALAILYPEATPVEGMEITYTINFTAYDGAAKPSTVVYTVTGPGQFKYKSCTWYTNGEDKDF